MHWNRRCALDFFKEFGRLALFGTAVLLAVGTYRYPETGAGQVPEKLPPPREVKDAPEPPDSPNTWCGEWWLGWGRAGGSDYRMTLKRDGSYRAVGCGCTWEGTWEVRPCKADRSRVEFWVSESTTPHLPESWFHWGALFPKKLPRTGAISLGRHFSNLEVGMRTRR